MTESLMDHKLVNVSLASYATPDYLPISAWVKHGPFAFWLMERIKPRRFVELGTHHGFSFFAFCQAIEQFKLGTCAFAIDTWTGDEHAGRYDDTIYLGVSAVNDRYSGFSTLMRTTFDDALPYFDEGSIDLLHIDGQHHYEDVRHDYESWLPKLTDDAVVLFHDTNVRERQFGVWRFFKELGEKHPTFQFVHGHGLGIVCPGARSPDGLRDLLDADPGDTDATRLAYASLGAALEQRQKGVLLRAGLHALRSPEVDLSQEGLAALAIASGDEIAVVEVGTAIKTAETQSAEAARVATSKTLAEADRRIRQADEESERCVHEVREEADRRIRDSGEEAARQVRQADEESERRVHEVREEAARQVRQAADDLADVQAVARSEASLRDEAETRLASAVEGAAALQAHLNVAAITLDVQRACHHGKDREIDRLRSKSRPPALGSAEAEQVRAVLATTQDDLRRTDLARAEAAGRWDVEHDALLRWGREGRRQMRHAVDRLGREREQHAQTKARLALIEGSKAWRAYGKTRPGSVLALPPGGDVGGDADVEAALAAEVEATGLFDAEFYLETNPDVAHLGGSPALHFALSGWREGRRPNRRFDPAFYLEQRPDVAAPGTNPLIHYADYGILEGQTTEPGSDSDDPIVAEREVPDGAAARVRTSGLFDEEHYRRSYPDVVAASLDPAQHYAKEGWREGRNPSAHFDTLYYLSRYPDVAAAEVNPLLHFAEFGAAEGRLASAAEETSAERAGLSDEDRRAVLEIEETGLFDADFYASSYPDIAASGMDPTLHFARDGWREGRRPSALFDLQPYLRLNPDVAGSGQNPLLHYARFGAAEGRPVVDASLFREGGADTPAGRDLADARLKKAFTADATTKLRTFLNSGRRLAFSTVAQPDISVLVILWNQAHLTLRCLQTLAEQRGPSIEIILVDNASTDQTEQLLSRADGVKVIRNHENEGFLLACNRGAASALGRTLLLLNSDAFVRPGALAAALATLDRSPDVGAVGGRLILPSGRLQEAGCIVWSDSSTLGYGRGLDPEAGEAMFRRDVDYCSGAFLLTPMAVWHRLGGFDTVYIPAYYEEADYCMRLREHGLRVVYEPSAVVDHFEFGSESKRANTLQLSRTNRKAFRQRHALTLSSRHYPPSQVNILPARTRAAAGQRRLLIVDNEVPYRSLGSGYPRAREMAQEAAAAGWFVTFYPLHRTDIDWETARHELSSEIEIVSDWGAPRLADFLEGRRALYQTMIVSRPDNMALVNAVMAERPDLFSDMRVVYDAEALFSARDITMAAWNGSPYAPDEADRLVASEVALAKKADAVVCVSEPEAAAFRAAFQKPVFVLNHPTTCATGVPDFAGRNGFLFVGRLLERRTPNWEGLAWFVKTCWPAIRAALPDAVLRVAGPLADAHEALEGPGIELLDRVGDLGPVYAASRVFIAPVHFAAGIPIKMIEAAASGVPSVATPLMARQLSWTPGTDVLVAEEAEAFAECGVALHRDEALWRNVGAASLRRVGADYSSDQFRATLAQIVRA